VSSGATKIFIEGKDAYKVLLKKGIRGEKVLELRTGMSPPWAAQH